MTTKQPDECREAYERYIADARENPTNRPLQHAWDAAWQSRDAEIEELREALRLLWEAKMRAEIIADKAAAGEKP